MKLSKNRVKVRLDHEVEGEKYKEYNIDSVSLLEKPKEESDT